MVSATHVVWGYRVHTNQEIQSQMPQIWTWVACLQLLCIVVNNGSCGRLSQSIPLNSVPVRLRIHRVYLLLSHAWRVRYLYLYVDFSFFLADNLNNFCVIVYSLTQSSGFECMRTKNESREGIKKKKKRGYYRISRTSATTAVGLIEFCIHLCVKSELEKYLNERQTHQTSTHTICTQDSPQTFRLAKLFLEYV